MNPSTYITAFLFPLPRSPNGSGTSACWTKRLRAMRTETQKLESIYT